MKEFFKDFSSLDTILTDQIIRYRASFKLLLLILIVSLIASVSTSIYLLTMLKSSTAVANQRSYIVLNDTSYLLLKGNVDLDSYMRDVSYNISRNLLSINPASQNYNVDYIKSYTSYNSVLQGYYNWLNDKVLYLNTIKGLQIFEPKTFRFKTDNDFIKTGGIAKLTVAVEGDLHTISELKPKSVSYTLFLTLKFDATKGQYNPNGLSIEMMQIHETSGLKKQ